MPKFPSKHPLCYPDCWRKQKQALAEYDGQLCGPISEVVLRNRGAGPFGLLNLLDERCSGVFNDIDDVIPAAERAAFMANSLMRRGQFDSV